MQEGRKAGRQESMQEGSVLHYLKVYLALLVLGSKAQGSSCFCHIADVPHTMPHSLQAACIVMIDSSDNAL